jgi:small GTP-binding protein
MSKILLSLLGHVDVGKTSIINYFTKSKQKEVGNITQQIRAYSFDSGELQMITSNEKFKDNFIHDGIILIDTPGHEYFESMRKVTSYTSHFVILVVDIISGLEKTHKDIIKFLKINSIDFIIVLNKIDRISEWKTIKNATLKNTFANQKNDTLKLLNDYILNLICQFAELEVNVQVYYSNKDYKNYVSMVPISAKTGEGITDLLFLLSKLYTKKQKILNDKNIPQDLIYVLDRQSNSKFGLCTLCIKSGKSKNVNNIDNIDNYFVLDYQNNWKNIKFKVINNENDENLVSIGTNLINNGIFYLITDNKLGLTDIIYHKKLEYKYEDLALSNTFLMTKDNDVYDESPDIHIEEKNLNLLNITDVYKYKSCGICILSESTSMEGALNKIFSNVPIALFSDSKLDKSTIIKASNLMKFKSKLDEEFNLNLKVIAIFDPKYNDEKEYVSAELKSLLSANYIKLIISNTIYKLKDEYDKLKNQINDQLREKYSNLLDSTLEIIPEYIFLKSSPLLFGVIIKDGEISIGTKLFTNYNGIDTIIGKITSIKFEDKQIEKATKNMKVCIKIEQIDKKIRFFIHLDENSVLKTFRTKDEDKIFDRIKKLN